MAVCDTCGTDDDNAFTMTRGSDTATFDSFECAIHAMAPRCPQCGCLILGHGVNRDDALYCCEHCSRQTIAAAPASSDTDPLPDKHVSRWKDDDGAISS